MKASVYLPLVLALAHLSTGAIAVTHSWSGASFYPDWGYGGNWSSGGAPYGLEKPNRVLIFPANAVRKWASYGYLEAIAVDRLELWGTGYTLYDDEVPHEPLILRGGGNNILCAGSGHVVSLRLNLTGTRTVNVLNNGTLELSGQISGTGGLLKTGDGDLTIAGADDNLMAGALTVADGRVFLHKATGKNAVTTALDIGADSAGPSDALVYCNEIGQFASGASLTVRATGVFDTQNFSQVVGLLTMSGGRIHAGGPGTGYLILHDNVLTFPAANGQDSIIDGRLSLGGATRVFNTAPGTTLRIADDLVGGGGAPGLTKIGGGTLIISDTVTYTGPTVLAAGETNISTDFRSSSAVSVTQSARLVTQAGRFGPVTCAGTLSIIPSLPLAGCLSGPLSMLQGSRFSAELRGLAPGNQFSQLHVAGPVVLNGALDLRLGFDAPPGFAFPLIVNDGTDPVAGTFNGLPEGGRFHAAGREWRITYKGGTGNDVTVTPLTGLLPLTILGIERQLNGSFVITGTGDPDKDTYQLQASQNMAGWTTLGPVENDNGNLRATAIPPLVPRRFFRFNRAVTE